MIFEKIRELQRNLQDEVVRRTSIPDLERRAEYFAALFEKYLPANADILDIGGGWGFYAEPLAKRGHHLTVLDVVKPGYQKAPVVINEPGKPFPFPDKSFDASIMVTMLHHTPDPEMILREAKRVTRKVLIVVEDVYRHPLGRIWTIARDCFYNFEYIGHPCNFKNNAEWNALFLKLGLKSIGQEEVTTRLAGFSILNSVYALEIKE